MYFFDKIRAPRGFAAMQLHAFFQFRHLAGL